MKKVFFAIIGLAIAGAAWANPPNAFHTKYNPDRGELDVTVQHPVNNRLESFIDEIVLTKNGVEVERRTFDFQTSRRNQTTPPFKLQATSEDDVHVFAKSNDGASAEAKVLIPPAKEE